MKILKSQLESGVRVKGQLNEWFATHRPDDIMDDIHSGRVTFLEAELVSLWFCSRHAVTSWHEPLVFLKWLFELGSNSCGLQGQSCYDACNTVGQVAVLNIQYPCGDFASRCQFSGAVDFSFFFLCLKLQFFFYAFIWNSSCLHIMFANILLRS